MFISGFLGSAHVPVVYALLAHAQRGGSLGSRLIILCFPPNNGRETEGLFAHAQCDLDPHRGHIWVCLLEAPRIPEQTHVMIVAIEEGALTPDSGA